jgi:arginase family enzyme
MRKGTFSVASPTLFRAPAGDLSAPGSSAVGVVGMPTDWTHSSRLGSGYGPYGLRIATSEIVDTLISPNDMVDPTSGKVYAKSKESHIIDYGNAEIFPENPVETVESIARMTKAVRKSGAMPLALGGDHFNSYPACLGYSRALEEIAPGKKFGFIQIDGHLDFSDRLGAWGKYNHATNARRISELKNVQKSNMVWVGTSGWIDSEETGLIEEMGGKIFSSDDIRRMGAKKVAAMALEHALKGVDRIYLTIDIDATDAGFLPGTGSIVQSKLTPKQFCDILDVLSEGPIDGADIVEVAPGLDPSGRSERISACYLLHLLKKIII